MSALLTACTRPATQPPDVHHGAGTPLWPATTQALAAMRPTGRLLGTRRVALSDATDASIAAANDAGATLVTTDSRSGGALSWNYTGPDYRVDTLVGPGTHTGSGTGSWKCIVGTDPVERPVVSTTGLASGTIHTYGSAWLENLRIESRTDGTGRPKYPWHITGGQVSVAINCEFWTDGAQAIGMDGESGHYVLLYGCTLNSTTNFHGPADGSNQSAPITYVLVNCTSTHDVTMTATPITGGGKSTIHVIGGSIPGIVTNAHIDVYTDHPTMPVTGANSTTRGVTTWPGLVGGLPDNWRAHYYPSKIGQASRIEPGLAGAAPMAPVPGRVYITRVKSTTAMRARRVHVQCTTAAGQFAAFFTPADASLGAPTAAPAALLAPTTALTAGDKSWTHYYAYTRHPGDGGWWAKCQFSSADARVLGSTILAGETDCYYSDDGTTLVPVAAGTAHPVMAISDTL